MGRDFLAPMAPTPEASPYGTGIDLANAISGLQEVMVDIRRELMKQNPEVLSITRVQGINTIAAGDTSSKRVFFEVGGKAVTVFAIWIYSSYTGNAYVSVNSMATGNDGLVFAAGDQVYLPLAVDSVNIMTDGAAACPINTPADPTTGGLFIYGWTIPDYDRNRNGM